MMKTLILPGFSPHNKEWAEKCRSEIKLDHEIHVVEWPHWESGKGSDFKLEEEVRKIVDLIGDGQVNIIAKSVGTAVTTEVIRKAKDKINKIILCGLPLGPLRRGSGQGAGEERKKRYEVFADFPVDKLLCFQNGRDPLGSFEDMEKFVHSINSDIVIKKMPRGDHEYPYFREFETFLGK